MSWTERLNDALPRVRLGTAVVEVHEWAHWDQPMDGPPHRHSYFVICRVEGGEGEFTAGERRHRILPGDLLFARPGIRHRILGAEGFRLSCVAFEVVVAQADGDDDISIVLQRFLAADAAVAKDTGGVATIWELLKETASGPRGAGQNASLITLGQALLVGLARAGGGDPRAESRGDSRADSRSGGGRNGGQRGSNGHGGNGRGDGSISLDGYGGHDGLAAQGLVPDRHARAVRLAVRYIHDNLDRPLRVEELAKQVNVSPRQLTRLFATLLDEPPASYVERVRLEHAAHLLARTQTPIKQIAAELGYPDVPTFTRAFARQHQSPPGRYRRANLGGIDSLKVDHIDGDG